MTAFNQTHNDGVVRAREAGTKLPDGTYTGNTKQFTVPAFMARKIPAGARFRAEWHEDGILYRFLGVGDDSHIGTTPPKWTSA